LKPYRALNGEILVIYWTTLLYGDVMSRRNTIC